jgi:hypothetical protein
MIIATVSFITLFVNWYNNRLFPLIRQFFFIPYRINEFVHHRQGRLCGLVVRVLGYRSGGPGSIPGTARKEKSSGSGTGFTQPREYS